MQSERPILEEDNEGGSGSVLHYNTSLLLHIWKNFLFKLKNILVTYLKVDGASRNLLLFGVCLCRLYRNPLDAFNMQYYFRLHGEDDLWAANELGMRCTNHDRPRHCYRATQCNKTEDLLGIKAIVLSSPVSGSGLPGRLKSVTLDWFSHPHQAI